MNIQLQVIRWDNKEDIPLQEFSEAAVSGCPYFVWVDDGGDDNVVLCSSKPLDTVQAQKEYDQFVWIEAD